MFTNEERQKERTGKYGTPREQYLQGAVIASNRLEGSPMTSLCLCSSSGMFQQTQSGLDQELVTEFQKTPNEESKEQIVAHLANFAYDPYNYNFFRKLNVLDLFLDCITESNEKLVEFGAAGICNCCADPANAAVIAKNGGISLMISCLSSPVQNTVLSAISALYYLCTPSTKAEILTPEVIEVMRKYEAARSINARFSNLAMAFLDKHVKS